MVSTPLPTFCVESQGSPLQHSPAHFSAWSTAPSPPPTAVLSSQKPLQGTVLASSWPGVGAQSPVFLTPGERGHQATSSLFPCTRCVLALTSPHLMSTIPPTPIPPTSRKPHLPSCLPLSLPRGSPTKIHSPCSHSLSGKPSHWVYPFLPATLASVPAAPRIWAAPGTLMPFDPCPALSAHPAPPRKRSQKLYSPP